MNIRFLNILAIGSLFAYLLGNVIFAWLDSSFHSSNYFLSLLNHVNKHPNPNIFYIPDGIKNFALIWLCKNYAKKESLLIYCLWWFFFWLSIGQLIDFLITNPYAEKISDYLFLCVAMIDFIFRLHKLKANARKP